VAIWLTILAEVRDDKAAELSALVVFLLVATRLVAAPHRNRIRSSVILFGLFLALLPIAGVLRFTGSIVYRETRLAALTFATLSLISLTATLLFSALLPRARIATPRILQDVIVAASCLLAFFMLATHAGLNLSGLIATSAVLTAVIGLAFQDTLGNVVGGLALQLDDSVKVGDWIKVGDIVGQVTEIRWRYTAIETRNWETVILPNSLLVKGQVTVLGRREGQPQYWRRIIFFNVDYRYPPNEVIRTVEDALRDVVIDRVARSPAPNCVLMDLSDSFGRYALRYWLTDLHHDDGTDSVIRTRIFFALRRARIQLSMPAHAVFLTEDTEARKTAKGRVDQERRLAALSRVVLFSGLSKDEYEHLAEHLTYAPFAAGETMTRQGAEAHYLYMVVKGEVSVRVGSKAQPESEVARIGPGEFFGEMGLLTGERRAATIVAVTPVECYRLDKSAFQDLMSSRPELSEQIADLLAKRRLELIAAREGLDRRSRDEQLRITRTDLLSKIRVFFSLDDEDGRGH
jgi:small-conductance mechanosensitive channel/CRP-like cAMP-binding protein